jgi:uncharacterized DUF497 family protein
MGRSEGGGNVRQHGVDFEEASSTFYDPLALLLSDEYHSDDEPRFILLGRSPQDRLLVTVFAERGDAFRIISSRHATPREVRAYEEGV